MCICFARIIMLARNVYLLFSVCFAGSSARSLRACCMRCQIMRIDVGNREQTNSTLSRSSMFAYWIKDACWNQSHIYLIQLTCVHAGGFTPSRDFVCVRWRVQGPRRHHEHRVFFIAEYSCFEIIHLFLWMPTWLLGVFRVIFGIFISLPVTIVYYILLGSWWN
jgi:hypothetical protein